MDQEPVNHKARRGIYLLPNLFTTAGLFAGFYGIVASIGGRFEVAALAVFVAMIMDGIDGRVARLTNTQSEFGVQYDSLSDLVCFGLAPALIMYQWALRDMTAYGWFWAKVGWLTAFIYAAAAALRLARFNAQVEVADKRYFQGLPSPSATAFTSELLPTYGGPTMQGIGPTRSPRRRATASWSSSRSFGSSRPSSASSSAR